VTQYRCAASGRAMSLFNTILVPVDFGPHSDEAVWVAAALASRIGARVILAHVYSSDGEACSNGNGSLTPEERRRLVADREHQMNARRIVLQEAGVREFGTRFIGGKPSEEISRIARQGGFDLIVMGSRGRTLLGLKRLGSVAQAVRREASCALLFVYSPREVAPTLPLSKNETCSARPNAPR
jgi:universal stress protein A